MSTNKPLVLILCGGQSLRLWPLSEYKSKNFVGVFSFSPLETTIRRFSVLTSKENIFLVASQREKKQLYRLKGIKKDNIFFEPQSKNTAAAVLLSLLHLQKHKQQPLIITPVDNLVGNEQQFFSAVRRAVQATSKGVICTIGIKARKPSPHFGYIQPGKRKAPGIFGVKKFIEKPTVSAAKKFIAQGNYFYNSGMFIAAIGTLLEEYQRYYPAYKRFIKSFGRRSLSGLYSSLGHTPFDKAIMEKTKKAWVVKGAFFWKDFGSWHTLYELLAKDKHGNVATAKTHIYNGSNNFIYVDDPGKKVLVLGLRDVFFIDTDGYTLLTARDHIDELKGILSKLKK